MERKNCFTKRRDKKERKKNYFLTLDGKWINGVPFESWYCHVLCVLYALNCFHKHECHVNLYRFQNAKNSADRKTVIKEQKPIGSRANNISNLLKFVFKRFGKLYYWILDSGIQNQEHLGIRFNILKENYDLL